MEDKPKISVGLLTVSDRCFKGTTQDLTGPCIQALISEGSLINAEVTVLECIPDEKVEIVSKLTAWCDRGNVNIIFTMGGTGFSPRDVTPEGTKSVIEKEAPGLNLAMLKGSLEITPLAMLSRPACGIRKKTLIVNLPGSPKAAEECFRIIAPSLQHAVDLILGSKEVEETHKKMQEGDSEPVEASLIFHTCQHKKHRDVNAVAFRPRTSPFPMITVDEAQILVLDHCIPATVEKIYYLDGINRVLAADVFAKDPLPPFPASIKDGYAVIAADGKGPRKLMGVSVAGSQPEMAKVLPGFCARISTGAPLPPGADSVVMVEETKLLSASDDGQTEIEIEILSDIKVGQEIRPVGFDVKNGEKVLPIGTSLTASDIGILATVGAVDIDVFALPIVTVLSTGNELQESQLALEKGRIRDTNRPTLMALFKQHGFHVSDAGIAVDDAESLYQRLALALETADVLVSTGGVSMGEKDLLRDVLTSKFGAQIHFARVNMKPGKPTTFATCQVKGKSKLIFGLPGNPVSAVVTSHLYVIPACRKMAGQVKFLPVKIKAELRGVDSLQLDARTEYHRVEIQWEGNNPIPRAISTGSQMSCRLLSMSKANGLAILPPKSDKVAHISQGTLVDVIIIEQL